MTVIQPVAQADQHGLPTQRPQRRTPAARWTNCTRLLLRRPETTDRRAPGERLGRLLQIVGRSFGNIPRQAGNCILKPRPLAVAADRQGPFLSVEMTECDSVGRIGFRIVGADPLATVSRDLQFSQRVPALPGEIFKAGATKRAPKFGLARRAKSDRERVPVGKAELHGALIDG